MDRRRPFFAVPLIIGIAAAQPASAQRLDPADILLGIIQSLPQQQQQPYQQPRPAPQFQQAPAPQRAAPAQQPAAPAALVAEIQALVADLGYDPGPVDGVMGGRTRAAIAAFQADAGLAQTGAPSGELLTILRTHHQMGRARPSGPRSPGPQGMPSSDLAGGGPSFECADAASPTENAICASPSLMALDAEMAAAYHAALSSRTDAAALREEQNAWIAARNSCGSQDACIDGMIRERLAQLNATTESTVLAGEAEPVDGQGTSSALSSTLNSPPDGVDGFTLHHIEGVPVLNAEAVAVSERDDGAFFRLVAVGARPDLMTVRSGHMDHAGDMARIFLSEAAASDILVRPNSTQFLGANEFEKDASRRRFLDRYTDILAEWAPKPPFVFAVARQAFLPEYDGEKQGFAFRWDKPPHDDLDFAWLTPRPEVDELPAFWPRTAEEAQAAIEKIGGGQVARDGTHGRRILLVSRYEATGVDAETLTLGIRRLGTEIWDMDLTERIGVLDEKQEADGVAAADSGDPARFASPPLGIRPIESDVEDGIVFPYDDGVAHFFEALTYALDPSRLESDWQNFVRSQFTPEGAAPYADTGRIGATNPNNWVGADEFEQAATRAAFYERYRQPYLDWAPRLPARYGARHYRVLGEYNAEWQGFPIMDQIGIINATRPAPLKGFVPLHRSIGVALKYTRSIDWEGLLPEGAALHPSFNGFLPMEMDEAQQLVERLRSATPLATGGQPAWPPRLIGLREIVTVERVDERTGELVARVESARIMDPTFSSLVMELPLREEIVPGLNAELQGPLHVAEPLIHDTYEENSEQIVLRAAHRLGLTLSDVFLDTVARRILERDRRFYDDPSRDLAANDVRLPFFPNESIYQLTEVDPDRSRFRKWLAAYGAGLPNSSQWVGDVAMMDDRLLAVRNFFTSAPASLPEIMLRTGLPRDHIINLSVAGQEVVAVMPRPRAEYELDVPPEILAAAQSGGGRVVNHVSYGETLAGPNGSIIQHVVPERMEIRLEDGSVLFSHVYQTAPAAPAGTGGPDAAGVAADAPDAADAPSSNAPEPADAPPVMEYDILGLTLGMPIEEAEEAIYTTFGTIERLARAGSLEPGVTYANGVLLHDLDRGDLIALYSEPAAEGAITGIARTQHFAPGAGPDPQALIDLLRQKYGDPDPGARAPTDVLVWWSDGHPPESSPRRTDMEVSACARNIAADLASWRVRHDAARRERENGTAAAVSKVWLDEKGAPAELASGDGIDMAAIFGKAAACDADVLMAWLAVGADGKVAELNVVLTQPARAAEFGAALGGATTAADIKL